jgi:hypothetical protein
VFVINLVSVHYILTPLEIKLTTQLKIDVFINIRKYYHHEYEKNILAACLVLSTIGVTSTSALATNNMAIKEPTVSSTISFKNAVAMNTLLANNKYITLSQWNANILKIA